MIVWRLLEWERALDRVLPAWTRGDGLGLLPVPSDAWASLPPRADDSRAWLSDPAGSARELLGAGGWRLDPWGLLRGVIEEHGRMPAEPLYLRQPLPVHRLPGRARQMIAGILTNLDRKHEWMDPAASADLLSCLIEREGPPVERPDRGPFPMPKDELTVCLTHDADSGNFQTRGDGSPLLRLERSRGFTSTWFLTTGRHALDCGFLDALRDEGHELAWHDTVHDHRLSFLSPEAMSRRVEASRGFLERYAVRGVRSPNYFRSPRYFECMGRFFSYDSSRHDSYPPREGSGTCRPFRDLGGLLQAPVSIQEDFFLLRRRPDTDAVVREQIRQIERVRARRGVVLLNTHPEPELSERPQGMAVYEAVLDYLAAQPGCRVLRVRDLADRCA
ncbi:MAG: hypothetical protein HY748_16020 [Elusimicrobia bacterium]|nr:hypothetical protein [Elusimicrobiota bacterium]